MSNDEVHLKILSYLPYILNHTKYFRVREIMHILTDYSELKVEDYDKPMIFASNAVMKIAREVAEDPIKNVEKLFALQVTEDMMYHAFECFYKAYRCFVDDEDDEPEDLERFIDEVFEKYNEENNKIESNYFQSIMRNIDWY